MAKSAKPVGGFVSSGWRTAYRGVGLGLAVVFALVGLLFLFDPRQIPALFNGIAPSLGLPQSPEPGGSLYTVLAVAYISIVTILAFRMYNRPDAVTYPRLLVQAKAASAVLSLIYCVFGRADILIETNALVDGLIAVGIAVVNGKAREKAK